MENNQTTTVLPTNYGTLHLRTGVLDAGAVIAFQNGHCHSFALALHQRTGWPIMGIGGVQTGVPRHCVVYSPTLDTYIDVEGPGAEKRWPECFTEQLMLIEAGQVAYLPAYREPKPELAAPFVDTLLREMAVWPRNAQL